MSVIDVPEQEPPAESRVEAYRRGRSAPVWHWTAGSGMALVLLATMHIVAQHFVVHQKGGLRTYAEVLTYIGNPVIFVLEAAFLVTVTIHAMLGLRGVLGDRNPSPGMQRRIDRWLWIIGTVTIGYGMALLITLAVRS